MITNIKFCGIDRSPWLSLKQIAYYLGDCDVQTARRYVKAFEDRLNVSRGGPGGKIMVKLSSIERIMNAGCL